MAPNGSAVFRTVNNSIWKIHDRRMSEWMILMGMHKELLPIACPREN